MDESVDPPAIDPVASRRIFLGMVALLVGGALAFSLFRGRISPPPPVIANDPLLVEGRELYLSRCASCHGPSGRGDGPTARILAGPKPGNLTDREWKHGDQPQNVLRVVARGVPNTAMPGWSGTFTEDQIRAVSAFVYWLGGRPVPPALRKPGLSAGASGR